MNRYRGLPGSKATTPSDYDYLPDPALQLQLHTVETSARLAPLCCAWLPEELDSLDQKRKPLFS